MRRDQDRSICTRERLQFPNSRNPSNFDATSFSIFLALNDCPLDRMLEPVCHSSNGGFPMCAASLLLVVECGPRSKAQFLPVVGMRKGLEAQLSMT
jgi:hypothetical protein